MHPLERQALFFGIGALAFPAFTLSTQLAMTDDIVFGPIATAQIYLQAFWPLIASLAVAAVLSRVVLRHTLPRLRTLGLLCFVAFLFSHLVRFVSLFVVETLAPVVPRGGLNRTPDFIWVLWSAHDIVEVIIYVTAIAFLAICGAALFLKWRGAPTAS